MNRKERRNMRRFGWLTAGIGIGTAAALLWAPYTGEEIRFALRRGYHRAVKRVGRRSDDLRERAEDLIEHAHDFREDLGKQSRRLLRRLRAA